MFCRLVQNRLLVFVHCNELDINPSTYPHWERVKSNPNQETLLSLLFCTNQVICFCTIFSFKISPSLLPTEKRILLPHFEKKIIPSHLYLMGEVIFEVFFETFSKTLHLFGMGRGILQPQTKIFSSLVHKKMYSIKNYPLTLNAKKAREI